MKLFDQFKALSTVSKCVVVIFGTAAILYGGSKSTNNVPPLLGMSFTFGPPAPTPTYTLVTNWTARGAWNDWRHLDFPSNFAFTVGLTQLQGLTLMSRGEIRSSLTNTCPLAELPYWVALKPGESTVTHGYTGEGSYRFTWENAYVDRDPTNRVTASIELYASGAIAVTTRSLAAGPAATPVITYSTPSLPDGYVGHGQSELWATNAFPFAATEILEDGYDLWVSDYVGINEQNGHYKASVTIAALPEDGTPCYLECGPYKVNVVSPGTYVFPLEVFTHYPTRTYPVALPLTVAYDDGYRGTSAATNAPPPVVTSPATNFLDICLIPEFKIAPSTVYVHSNETAEVSVWINSAYASRKTWRSLSGNTNLTWLYPSYARIFTAELHDTIVTILEEDGIEIDGSFDIVVAPADYERCPLCWNQNCPCHGSCDDNCTCHVGTNGIHCVNDPL